MILLGDDKVILQNMPDYVLGPNESNLYIETNSKLDKIKTT